MHAIHAVKTKCLLGKRRKENPPNRNQEGLFPFRPNLRCLPHKPFTCALVFPVERLCFFGSLTLLLKHSSSHFTVSLLSAKLWFITGRMFPLALPAYLLGTPLSWTDPGLDLYMACAVLCSSCTKPLTKSSRNWRRSLFSKVGEDCAAQVSSKGGSKDFLWVLFLLLW